MKKYYDLCDSNPNNNIDCVSVEDKKMKEVTKNIEDDVSEFNMSKEGLYESREDETAHESDSTMNNDL